MVGTTEASSLQSAWLEELADVDCDWDSISPPSTPNSGTVALSSPTEDAALLPHGNLYASLRPVSSSSTDDELFDDTTDLESFLRETEGENFPSTASTYTMASTSTLASTPVVLTPAVSASRPGSSSSAFSAYQTPKRIIRGRFPPALKSNSPVPGLTSSLCVRTLFCLGEALNLGCQAVRDNQGVLLEFYCRVMSSYREDNIQHFVLADLTHDNPPFINATFAS
ncbi:hypothetical protein E4T43_01832 [Aureobasidium subglaciale]|nr:hypothetical protein E4T43_01832 [Aureobasidium subglaciale]